MIQWRYLTTIRGMVAETAALYGGDLYVGGVWGLEDTYGDRDAWAPLMRIGAQGEVSLCYEWPAEAKAHYAAGAPLGLMNDIRALATWNGQLWVSGDRTKQVLYQDDIPNRRLAAFDGQAWITYSDRHFGDLCGGDIGLVCREVGGALKLFDGMTFETILADPWAGSIRVLSDGSIACFAGARVVTAYRGADGWEVAQGPTGSPNTYRHSRSYLEYWRDRLWSVTSDTDGYHLSCIEPRGTAWDRVVRINRDRPYPVVGVRGGLVLYAGATGTFGMPTDESAMFAEFDGKVLSAYYPEMLVPYLVIPIDGGGAVAFSRTLATRNDHRIPDPPGSYPLTTRYLLPDADTLVYVTWPEPPSPPIVPYGDLEGNVTDTLTAAIEDAEVATGQLYDFSDALGDYAIPTVAIGRHVVGAAKPAYQPQVAEVSIEQDETAIQDFELPALTAGKAAIWGFCRDALTGGGLYGATVGFAEGIEAETGAGGFYSKELDPGTYGVTAELAGYVFASGAVSETLAEGDVVRVDLFLYPDAGGETPTNGDIIGTVRDLTTGDPLGDVVVDLGAYEAITDGAGHYERRSIPAGVYSVALALTGYIGVSGASVEIVAGQTTRADFGMVPTATAVGSLRVTVTDAETSAVISGAWVEIVGAAAGVTDAAGQVTVGNLPAGTFTVIVTEEGYLPNAGAGTVVPTTTVDVGIALTARDGDTDEYLGYLWGLVRDVTDRDPIAGAEVGAGGNTDTTGADGFYVLDGLTAGPDTVTAEATGYHTQSIGNVPVPAGTGLRLDIGMVPDTVLEADLLTVGGYVLDAADRSVVPSAEVWLDSLATRYTDEWGRYQFIHVLAGLHDLDGRAAGFYPTHIGNVPGGAECDIPLWRYSRMGELVVTVVDGDGATVAGAMVAATGDLQRVTGDLGTVTFDLPEDLYRLVAYKDGYVPGTVLAEVGAEATTTATVVIVAQEPEATNGYLVGYVVDQWTRGGLAGAGLSAADGVAVTGTSGLQGWFSLALAEDTWALTGSKADYVTRTVADIVVASRECTWVTLPLLPGGGNGDDPEELLVLEPPAQETPPATILVQYEEHDEGAQWDIAVSTDGGTRFRRAQRVPRGIETVIEQPGTVVKVLARKVTGKIGGVGIRFGF